MRDTDVLRCTETHADHLTSVLRSTETHADHLTSVLRCTETHADHLTSVLRCTVTRAGHLTSVLRHIDSHRSSHLHVYFMSFTLYSYKTLAKKSVITYILYTHCFPTGT